MKGECEGFSDIGGVGDNGEIDNGYENGKDYNIAHSGSVGRVDSVQTVANQHNMPISSSPYSVIRNFRSGSLASERYYGKDGLPYLDIDYTDHGNSKMHPKVPHEHKISFKNGELFREKYDGRVKR